jgi:NADH dehydrogenase/NADH:ubiquinone oxidoreductase subunit G
MKINIDGKEILVEDSSKNIVEIADDNGISIMAPCFRNGRKGGCCNVCLLEIDGEEAYACGTKAKDGMDIVYDRDDLKVLRKERLANYVKNIQNGDITSNSCCGPDSDTESGTCGCSDTSCCG